MNASQKRILIAMIVIIVGMLLYSPFHVVANNGTIFNMGYDWITDPPKRGYIAATVNVAMLLIQWVGVFVVGGLAFFLAKTPTDAPVSSRAASAREQSSHDPQQPRPEKPLFTEVQSESKPGPSGVGGWLLLLIVGMMVLGPLLGAGRINADIMMAEHQYPDITSLQQWKTYKTVTWWIFFAVVSISFYGGLGLARGNDGAAVSRAKAILWITGPGASLVLRFLVPIMVFGESNAGDQFMGAFIASIIAAAIWTTYLAKSKRVRNTYFSGSISEQEATSPRPTSYKGNNKNKTSNYSFALIGFIGICTCLIVYDNSAKLSQSSSGASAPDSLKTPVVNEDRPSSIPSPSIETEPVLSPHMQAREYQAPIKENIDNTLSEIQIRLNSLKYLSVYEFGVFGGKTKKL
jgi:hypothetical protein